MTEPTIEELIEHSSLGTPGARKLRDRTPIEVLERFLERIGQDVPWPPAPSWGGDIDNGDEVVDPHVLENGDRNLLEKGRLTAAMRRPESGRNFTFTVTVLHPSTNDPVEIVGVVDYLYGNLEPAPWRVKVDNASNRRPLDPTSGFDERVIHILCDGDKVALPAVARPSINEIALGAVPGLPKIAFHWVAELPEDIIILGDRYAMSLGHVMSLRHVMNLQDWNAPMCSGLADLIAEAMGIDTTGGCPRSSSESS